MSYGNNGYGGNNGYQQTGSRGQDNGGSGYRKNYNSGGDWKQKKPYQPKDLGPVEIAPIYAILGAPDTPSHVLQEFSDIARMLAAKKFKVRVTTDDSRKQEGKPPAALVGKAVRETVGTRYELIKPWNTFGDTEGEALTATGTTSDRGVEMAALFQPAMTKLPDAVKKIIAANVHVMLGKFLESPVEFLVCYTEDGAENSKEVTFKTGNVGLAIRVATSYNIPVINFKNPNSRSRLEDIMKYYPSPSEFTEKRETNYGHNREDRRVDPTDQPNEDYGYDYDN